MWLDLAYFAAAIVFVSAVESLLCSSMADRLANNRKTPFNPDKELWGQGLGSDHHAVAERLPCSGSAGPYGHEHQGRCGHATGRILQRRTEVDAGVLPGNSPRRRTDGVHCGHSVVGGNQHGEAVGSAGSIPARLVTHTFLMVFTAVMVALTDFLTGVLAAHRFSMR